ncbi:hypothetical protein E2562_024531 [Oryza meyeriana var. granulata]|uniref:WAT1-related protein n=1 Tax=Oryza meyeriana var. granulata TaxID=110450 RepID=A0A6G1BNP4_9ORYZ|nr:hypothetical protein E2562_024531 [Oryza meyeriana var. granulata]
MEAANARRDTDNDDPAERDIAKWKLGWNVELVAVIYSGMVVTALSYYMQMWTIAKRGPVFLAMSMPLTFIFTIIMSSFILGMHLA